MILEVTFVLSGRSLNIISTNVTSGLIVKLPQSLINPIHLKENQ